MTSEVTMPYKYVRNNFYESHGPAFLRTERARFAALIRHGHNGTTLDPKEHRILEKGKRACAIPRLRPFPRTG